MSLAQLTHPSSIGNPTPKFLLDQSSGNTLSSVGPFTMMVWARFTGGTDIAYNALMTVRDSTIGGAASDDQIAAVVLHVVGGNRLVSLGDVDTDVDSARAILPDVWHHYALIGEQVPTTGSPSQRVRLTCLVDGVQVVRSNDTEITPPVFPHSDCYVQLFNSRSSDTDAADVWQGYMAGLKIWREALTPADVWREMWYYNAVRRRDIFAVVPMVSKDSAGQNFVGADFTVQGANFVHGVLDPPGVAWETSHRASAVIAPGTAALTGTMASAATEADVVAGGKTIILTLTNDLWIPA